MEPIELTISDGEETYVVVATSAPGGWMPTLYDATAESVYPYERAAIWPVGAQPVLDAAPYPTPWPCLEALIRFVGTELFGIRA